MKKTIKSILLIGALAAGVGSLASCSDNDDSFMSRLFRPVISTDDIIAGIDAETKKPYIAFSWDNYANANKYIIKLVTEDGSDSLNYSVAGNSIMVSDLAYDTNYNISIKATDSISGKESREYTFAVTSADYPTKLTSFSTSNIIDVAARVMWDNSEGDANYDSLQVVKASNDSVIHTYTLTEEDHNLCEKVISGLKPNTNYKVKAYANGEYQGKKAFKTVASENYGKDIVVDMRNVDDDDIYKCLSMSSSSSFDGIIDSLTTAYPDTNITIVLPGGTDIKMPTMNLKSTTGRIKLVTGLTLAGNANVCVAGNFAIAADVNVGSIEFEKINFVDAPKDGKGKDGSNFGGTYLFNLNGKGASIGSIKMSNCNVKYKRGICRLQNAVTIGSFTIDNCIVDSIGGYGIVNCDANNAVVNNVEISNSTFSNCEKFVVVSSSKKDNIINNVKVTNCTFAYCIANAKPFFDMKDKELQTYTLDKCLFGMAGPHNLDAVADGISGYSGSIAPSCSDCYFTSDLLWQKNAETGEVKAPLTGTTLKSSTADLFKSPETSNFTVMTKEVNGIGDPRWY